MTTIKNRTEVRGISQPKPRHLERMMCMSAQDTTGICGQLQPAGHHDPWTEMRQLSDTAKGRTTVNAPTCTECGTELTDWEGNVMVGMGSFLEKKTVDRLRVICKECTRYLDVERNGRDRWHHLWELSWVRDNFVYWLREVLRDQTSASSLNWTEEALNDFCELAAARIPGTTIGPIAQGVAQLEGAPTTERNGDDPTDSERS